MAVTYIHLSDIHFGQEKGGDVIIHDDVRDRLIDDAVGQLSILGVKKADGIIITGDIAYSGKEAEYLKAGQFFDTMAEAIGCERTSIQIVPGNHDIDHSKIDKLTHWMLNEISTKGEAVLDEFLEERSSRNLLYQRFHAYRPFAEAYDCSLDSKGGTASDHRIELAPGKFLRFYGLNSALICQKKDKPGQLLLGARQRVLPVTPGEELIVLSHHPLHWLRDNEDARRYVQNRARVFISGHEHMPAVTQDPEDTGCDILMLAAGAATPPKATQDYNFTYNIIKFDISEDKEQLITYIYPRCWADENKKFQADRDGLGTEGLVFYLNCPNFRDGAVAESQKGLEALSENSVHSEGIAESLNDKVIEEPVVSSDTDEIENYPLLLLKFFRDISPDKRHLILDRMGSVPEEISDTLTLAQERLILDSLRSTGKLLELREAIEDIGKKINLEEETQ
ncbi:MAG: metallophosphoesterase [Emcibacteraceae bacterium]|nr:metallophosphoesterase [Emcibacteraceae bacterium]